MKNYILSLILFLFCITTFSSCNDDSLFSNNAKTVNGVTTVSGIRAGGLERALFIRLTFVTHLVINDTIDSRDFKTMRDEMPNLSVLDLSNATIAAYNGYEGSGGTMVYRYAANAIPEYAFYNPLTSTANNTLVDLKLPNSIKTIKDFAFNRCNGLKGTLVIPSSVKDTIGKSAFGFCENLTGLTLSPAKLIGESAFQGCVNLTGDISILDSTVQIKPWAFANCEIINSFSISSTVNTIGTSCFNDCGALFNVNSASVSYSSVDGVLFNKDQSTLVQFPKSKTGSYTIPSTVGTIGNYSFANCTGLTSVIIPSNTSTIEDYAFSGCSGLSGAFLISSGITSIGTSVFDDCVNISSFNIAPTNTSYGFSDGVLTDLTFFTVKRCITSKSGAYILAPEITSIENSAFSNCSNLTSITLPESLFNIGQRAFYNCSGLTSFIVKMTNIKDFSCSASSFEGINFENCTLQVPVGKIANYQTAIGWKEFYNIVEN
jgi:hypothetical protein